ncbi:MAG: cytochrome c biogenesis protein CcsA [Caldisericales bacterium]|nr:cytochrome c biogenesis protein CcsA [Caldisericales bacterium]
MAVVNMAGNVLMWFCLGFSVLAAILCTRPRSQKILAISSMLSAMLASSYLMLSILNNNFQLSYVFHNSSISLSFWYKISAFWADKGGSMLLWLLAISIVTAILSFKPQSQKSFLVVLFAIQAFLAIFVIGSSTFDVLAQTAPDGLGLNVLLKSPWMAFHPPVIFLSYALMAVPFAMTVAYLFRPCEQNHQIWLSRMTPWLVASWFLLGLGIAMGSIWAYETLGWGGYWGWDPVENASLVPWLIQTVAIHAALNDENGNGNARSVVVAVLSSFCLVVMAVFLTRSGVLSDVSVHSFAGSSMLFLYLVMLLTSIGLSVFLCVRSWKFVPHGLESHYTSRYFMMSIGNIVLSVYAIFILAATLLPAITQIFGSPAVISQSFYQAISVPVAIIMCVGGALTPLMAWRKTNIKYLIKQLIAPLFFGLVFVVLAVEAGMADPLFMITGALASIMLISNFQAMLKYSVQKWGAFVSHMGVCLLLMGVVGSSIFFGQESVSLGVSSQNKECLDFGVGLEYVKSDGQSFETMYVLTHKDSEIKGKISAKWDTRSQAYFTKPFIHRSFIRDVMVYVSNIREDMEFIVGKGSSVLQGGYTVKLLEYNEDFIKVLVSDGPDSAKEIIFDKDNMVPGSVAKIDGKSYFLSIDTMGSNTVTFRLVDLRNPDRNTVRFTMTVMVKYCMLFVWLGMIITLLGLLWAFLGRLRSTRGGMIASALVKDKRIGVVAQ